MRAPRPCARGRLHEPARASPALIVADGFYECAPIPTEEAAVHYTVAGGEPFAFAGLWASWHDPEADAWLDSCTIITTTANAVVAARARSMPVILRAPPRRRWLDPRLVPAEVDALLVPYRRRDARRRGVELVNSAKNDGPELLDPLA